MVEVRLLGAFAVRDAAGRPVAIGAGRCGALLARLALADGRPVHRDLLCADLWAGEAPTTAVNKLQGHVSTLRKALGRGSVRTAGPAYAATAEVATDVTGWRAAVRQGLALADAGDDVAAMAALALAAESWRGEPLAGLADVPFLAAERAALEALHLEGVERRAALRLKHGFVAAALADLGEAVERHPFHEGLIAQLVLGTAMAGRQVEALLLHDRARARLAEEFGLEPGPALRDAQERVLRGALPAVAAAPARPMVRLGLPRLPAPLVGRGDELALLTALVADPEVRLVTLTGLGGVGKTRLAEAVVERLGRACWATLTGVADPGDAAEAVAAQLGLGPAPGGAAAALAAALSAGATPPPLVLDDVDRVGGAGPLIERLLLDVPGLTVLVTARRPLGLRAERRVVLDVLPVGAEEPDGAVRLLERRAALSAAGGDREVLAEIAAICGGLPLALELAAARARLLPLPELRDRLAASRAALGGSTVEQAIASSAALLPPSAVRGWAAASVFADGFTPAALAEVQGADLLAVLDDCEQMLDLGLVRIRTDRPGRRLELQPIVREHAAALLSEPDRAALTAAVAARAVRLVAADPGLAALAPERADLRAAVRHLRAAGDAAALARLLTGLAPAWSALGEGAELVAWIDETVERVDGGALVDLLLARVVALGRDAGPDVAETLDEAAALLPRNGTAAQHAELRRLRARQEAAVRSGGPVAAVPEETDPLALAEALIAAGEPEAAARTALAALAATHPDDRFGRCRLLVVIAAARLLDARIGPAADAEGAALRLVAGSPWTREKLTLLAVCAARSTWRGVRSEDAAHLDGLCSAGLRALGVAPAPAEDLLRLRFLRRVAESGRPGEERAAGERAVAQAGVHAAAEAAVQALLDDRSVRPARAVAPRARELRIAVG